MDKMQTDVNSHLGAGARLTGLFSAPRQTFVAAGVRPLPWAPLILVMLVSWITVFFTVDLIMDTQMDAMRDMMHEQGLAMAELDSTLEKMSGYTRISTFVGAPLGKLVNTAFWALVLWGLGSLMLGAKVSYAAVLEVAAYGELVQALGGLFRVPLMLGSDSLTVDLGLGAFVPTGTALHRLLSPMDPISVGAMVLVGIGLATMYRTSTGRAMGVVFGPWLASLLVFNVWLAGLVG